MMIWSLEIIFFVICILISIAFLTLLERKILGLIQLRKGPNKVGMSGILQPFSDALKLFTKILSVPIKSNQWSFSMGPILALSLMSYSWAIWPLNFTTPNFSLSILFFSALSASSVYVFILSGWGSNSWFSVVGCYRAVAQSISYEINLALILISIMLFNQSFNLWNYSTSNFPSFMLVFPPLFFIWLASSLAENNRTPFDFAEGESELVSGFNTEFSGGPFALLFLAEYGSILFMSFLTNLLFIQSFSLSIGTLFVTMWVLWVRGTSPRLRYDKLSNLAWTIFLPSSLSIFTLSILLSLSN